MPCQRFLRPGRNHRLARQVACRVTQQARDRLFAVVHPQIAPDRRASPAARASRPHARTQRHRERTVSFAFSAGNRSRTRTGPTSLRSRLRRCAGSSSTTARARVADKRGGEQRRVPLSDDLGVERRASERSRCSILIRSYRSSNRPTLARHKSSSCGSSADCVKRTSPKCCRYRSSPSSETGRLRVPGLRRGSEHSSRART